MKRYWLAVDIGASSGRHILSHIENGKLVTEEMHRFTNGISKNNGHFYWNTDYLFSEILTGMKKCTDAGKIPLSVGIDTWGVDYLLLDENDNKLDEAVAYRDSRTETIPEKVFEIIPEKELYNETGIQKQNFNTIYQLMADKLFRPELLSKAKTMLFMPDYLHFRLCGVKCAEYTIASTSQLLKPDKFDWHKDLIKKLGLPEDIFPQIKTPGTVLGSLLPEIEKEVGFNCNVILPPSHDTASAVLGTPFADGNIYISSGTWSLMGIESRDAICSEESRNCNLTNEGGYEHRFRYLKNIMGLWMIQNVKRELSDKYSFSELCEMAEKESISSVVDCNSNKFLAPESMINAVKDFCLETKQEVPETPGEIARVIYRSLAICYKDAAEQIEEITGKTFGGINIVGGGSNADYLNRLTALYTGKTVYAGPSEATAIGNIACQIIASGDKKGIEDVRKLIADSTDIKIYNP